MKILIVEDEPVTARFIKNCLLEIFKKKKLISIAMEKTLLGAECFIDENTIDLIVLDINLNGNDGFDLLKKAIAKSFHTIVISANTNRAIEAFQYEIIDFVPKPIDIERLKIAIERFEEKGFARKAKLKHIPIKKENSILLIKLKEVEYFEGASKYVNVILRNGGSEILKKTLSTLPAILPESFIRIHKSYIVSFSQIREIISASGNTYKVRLESGKVLPISRKVYRELKFKIN